MSTKKKIVISCIATFCATLLLISGVLALVAGQDGFDYIKFTYVKNLVDRGYIYHKDGSKMTDFALAGLVASLDDPYSIYYDKEGFSERMNSFAGNYVGIGITLTYTDGMKYPQITDIYEGSTAEKAGLQRSDVLVSVDGKTFTHKNYNELIAYTKGTGLKDPIGTKMKVMIERDGQKQQLVVERGEIKTSQVVYKMVSGTIGYMRVAKFDGNTVPGIKKALKSLDQQKMTGLVLDLRDNPGGDLDACVKACDLFLDKGVVVSTKDKKGNQKFYYSNDGKENVPMTILINGNSASASEVFTGAMKDRQRATIIGVTSFGKGIVQSLYELPDGSGLSLTTEQYFTPSGANIHKKGIKPDIKVELPDASKKKTIPQLTYNEDTQLQAAVAKLSK